MSHESCHIYLPKSPIFPPFCVHIVDMCRGGSLADIYGSLADIYGSLADIYGSLADIYGSFADIYGSFESI